MSEQEPRSPYLKATVYVDGMRIPANVDVRFGDPVFVDANGYAVEAAPGQPIGGFVSQTEVVLLRAVSASIEELRASGGPSAMVMSPGSFARIQAAIASALSGFDRDSAENADARRLHRERLLERLYGLRGTIYERPCAACGGPSPWFVCLLCSTGMPSKGTWRIKPEAAARIRAKMAAGAHVPKMPTKGEGR